MVKRDRKNGELFPLFLFLLLCFGEISRSYVHNKPDATFILSSCLTDESSGKKAEYLSGTLPAEEFEKYLTEC
ncbi:MAG: hypothetical protein R3Y07_05050 [Eubacteriales bacterium]